MNTSAFHHSASTPQQELSTDLRLCLPIDAPVLISGDAESARRLALTIHQRSPRSQGPFIAVSCGRHKVPLTGEAEIDLLELGRQAVGGTLFVENVDQTSPSLQNALMKVLEMAPETDFQDQPGPAAPRVVVASVEDLYGKVMAQEFREDLFYRLNVIHLTLPVEDDVQEIALPGTAALLLESNDSGDFRSEGARALSQLPPRGLTERPPADELFEFPAETPDVSIPSERIASIPTDRIPSIPTDRIVVRFAGAGETIGAEFRRLRRQLTTAGAYTAETASSARQLLLRNIPSGVKTLSLWQFTCGMLVGGSLVFLGTSARAQLAARSAQPAPTVAGSTMPADQILIPPVEVPEQPKYGRLAGGVYRSSLQVDSDPAGARVYLNNKSVGVTPLRLNDLAVGSRAVRVELSGYEPWSSAVTVTTAQRSRISANLRPLRPLRLAEQPLTLEGNEPGPSEQARSAR